MCFGFWGALLNPPFCWGRFTSPGGTLPLVPFTPNGGGGGWHKALGVGSVSLWRRLLASRP